jgi:hypothetical protein
MYSAVSFTLAGNQASGTGVNGFVVNTAVNSTSPGTATLRCPSC